MRVPSGVTDQYIYFVAVDATDLKTRETGLSGFTVYRSRNGAAAAAMITPTVNETDSSNMPGVYELLLDEDTTIDAGDDSQEMVFHITVSGMAPVTRAVEIYRRKITAGYTLGVESDGDLAKVNTLDGHTAQTADHAADIAAILVDTNELQSDDVPTLIAALNDVSSADVNAACDTALSDYDPPTKAELDTGLAALNDVSSADVNAACDTALSDYDPPTKAELDAGLAALNDLAAADVNAEVVDVLKTDTIADRSAGAPPAAPTFEQAIAYIYSAMRNSIDVDSGFKEFYNNAGILIWKKALSDDASNYVEAKGVAP